ncbi:MAG: ABC transporter permease [Alkalibacterium sp.]|nr:ABC transporter permease [Alkalibacterium sp.]MDN6293695.1 ABC transporter permease [Alkalibacterium sp.]MDN6295078.1 ABC transporter permease [Alkalibacterium sp.]MDN6326635.1 ABC transporter permease [Alkalibacterium sp.]MDN6397624.1 ABC transporter permease [Alkalibacterium sp.]
MTIFSVIAVFILGILLGLLLYETQKSDNIMAVVLYKIVAFLVNVFRSIPFIILIVLLIPFTKALVDSITGPAAGLPALIFSASPFYARLVESGFREVDKGVIEAAESMGASKWEVIRKVYIPESLPNIISGITVTAISLVGYTAMAGVIGAGGLGNLAFLEGFQRSRPAVTLVSTIIILLIVFIIQFIGDLSVKKIDKR